MADDPQIVQQVFQRKDRDNVHKLDHHLFFDNPFQRLLQPMRDTSPARWSGKSLSAGFSRGVKPRQSLHQQYQKCLPMLFLLSDEVYDKPSHEVTLEQWKLNSFLQRLHSEVTKGRQKLNSFLQRSLKEMRLLVNLFLNRNMLQ